MPDAFSTSIPCFIASVSEESRTVYFVRSGNFSSATDVQRTVALRVSVENNVNTCLSVLARTRTQALHERTRAPIFHSPAC